MSGAEFQGPVHSSNIVTGINVSGNGQTVLNFGNRAESKPFYVMSHERNEDFVFRPDITSRLEELLPTDSSEFQRAALWGLGGSGKTQIALEYVCNRYRKSLCSVFWVHADSQATFAHDYGSIAKVLGLKQQGDGDDLLQSVRRKIESLDKWLLVLDNADDLSLFGVGSAAGNSPSKITEYIPKGPNGTILWTSRDEQIDGSLVGPRRSIRVSKMTSKESRELVEKKSDRLTSKDELEGMNLLIEELHHLPLALSQAGTYMRRTETSISQYLSDLKQEQARWRVLKETVFDRHSVQGSSNNILETWSISILRIEKENEMAYKILHIIAYFDNQNIPRQLIEAAAAYGEEKQTKEELDRNTRKAVRRLKDFSFLTERQLDDNEPSFEMHKLVQDAARHGLQVGDALGCNGTKSIEEPWYLRIWVKQWFKASRKQERYFTGAAIRIIFQLYPDTSGYGTAPVKREMWDTCEEYLAHALRACDWAEQCREERFAIAILSCVSRYLSMRNRHKEQLLVRQHTVDLFQKVNGEKHPHTIWALMYLGWSLYESEESQQSEVIAEKALQMALAHNADKKHEKLVLACRRLVSLSHLEQGRLEEAEKVALESLEQARRSACKTGCERGCKSDDDFFECKLQLSLISYEQKRYEEATTLVLNVLEYYQTRFGEDSLETAGAFGRLGKFYIAQDKWDKAEETFSKALQLSCDHLGEDHQVSVCNMAGLALAWKHHGKSEEAVQMLRDCCRLSHEVLGAKHSGTKMRDEVLKEWLEEMPPVNGGTG